MSSELANLRRTLREIRAGAQKAKAFEERLAREGDRAGAAVARVSLMRIRTALTNHDRRAKP